jgi:hypothetical protein
MTTISHCPTNPPKSIAVPPQPPHQIIQPCKIQQRLTQCLKLRQRERLDLGFCGGREGAHATHEEAEDKRSRTQPTGQSAETKGLIFCNDWDSSCRAWYKSHRCCRFIQKSGDISKNWARRSAVLGVMPRRPFTISLIR